MSGRIAVVGIALLVVGACSDGGEPAPRTTAPVATSSAPAPSTSTASSTSTTSSVTTTTTAHGQTTTTVLATTTTTAASLPDLPTDTTFDADLVASDLRAVTGCDETDPSVAFADLSWRPATSGGRQRVQVTADAGGFDGGAVSTGPELDGTVDSVRWLELAGQAVHSWRVLTEAPDGSVWYVSAVMQFEGPLCAVDYQDR